MSVQKVVLETLIRLYWLLLPLFSPSLSVRGGEGGNLGENEGRLAYLGNCSQQSLGSEVENGHVEEVAQAFCLVQVVYVVVVAGWRGQTKERREHF